MNIQQKITKEELEFIHGTICCDSVLIGCGKGFLPTQQIPLIYWAYNSYTVMPWYDIEEVPKKLQEIGYRPWYGIFDDAWGIFPVITYFPEDTSQLREGQLIDIWVESSKGGYYSLHSHQWEYGKRGFSRNIVIRHLADYFVWKLWKRIQLSEQVYIFDWRKTGAIVALTEKIWNDEDFPNLLAELLNQFRSV